MRTHKANNMSCVLSLQVAWNFAQSQGMRASVQGGRGVTSKRLCLPLSPRWLLPTNHQALTTTVEVTLQTTLALCEKESIEAIPLRQDAFMAARGVTRERQGAYRSCLSSRSEGKSWPAIGQQEVRTQLLTSLRLKDVFHPNWDPPIHRVQGVSVRDRK